MVETLINKMRESCIDAALIYDIYNVRYLSGYKGDDAYLLISEKSKYFITDARYTEQAELECPEFKIINWKDMGSDICNTIAHIVDKENIKLLGMEENTVSYRLYSEMSRKIAAKTVDIAGMVEDMRTIKSPEEIVNIEKACLISERAFNRILKDIKVGVTETELSAKLAYYLKAEGSDARYYENILLSGVRTSLLHGIPSDKKIAYGDLILMDFGAGYKGYLSDMSRTVVVGKANEKQREIFNIIKASLDQALEAIRDGIRAKEVYAASLKPIRKTEYLADHYSGIGHGIGLAVHEKPYIGPTSADVLKKNNVITIEPGIYIPGWGGVRIEDQILITDEGCKVMTNASRQLIEL